MFISKKRLNGLINKAYLDGYSMGEKSGYKKAIFDKYSINEIRAAFDLPPIENHKKEEVTEVLDNKNKELDSLKKAFKLLNIIYEWKLEVKEVSDGTLGYFIYSPYGEGYYNITEDHYNNFKEVLKEYENY